MPQSKQKQQLKWLSSPRKRERSCYTRTPVWPVALSSCACSIRVSGSIAQNGMKMSQSVFVHCGMHRFRRMLKDPLILAENPMLLEEMRKIEAAKLLREQEMAAANNAVDEFRRAKSAPETTRKSFSTMLNKKKEGTGSKGDTRDSTRECADSKAGSSADADDSFVRASHSKVDGDDLSDDGQASEPSSWIKIRSGLKAMKNLKDKLTEVTLARGVSGPHTPSCTDEPANPCPTTDEGK